MDLTSSYGKVAFSHRSKRSVSLTTDLSVPIWEIVLEAASSKKLKVDTRITRTTISSTSVKPVLSRKTGSLAGSPLRSVCKSVPHGFITKFYYLEVEIPEL